MSQAVNHPEGAFAEEADNSGDPEKLGADRILQPSHLGSRLETHRFEKNPAREEIAIGVQAIG